MKLREIERAVNLRQSQIEKVLKLLVVEPQPPRSRIEGVWYRTPMISILISANRASDTGATRSRVGRDETLSH